MVRSETMNSTILPGVALETDRLRLRCHRDGDLLNLIALADNWRVARWLIHLAHPYSEANGREWIPRLCSNELNSSLVESRANSATPSGIA